MKKMLWLLMLLTLVLPMAVLAEMEGKPSYIEEDIPDEPLWKARLRIGAGLRTSKDPNRKGCVRDIEVGSTVDVYNWSEEWCVVGYDGAIGYVPTRRLATYRQLSNVPIPGGTIVEGIARMTQNVHLEVEGYRGGNDVQPGALICVKANGLTPMMRRTTTLPAGSYTFEPFVKPAESKEGDALYGYTTFYNALMDMKFPANRAYNIELAVERLQGVIIPIGGKFSFNSYCGPYTQGNGYMRAKNVSDSGYGFGGGVCQVSTTIFNAVMPISHTLVSWRLHSIGGVAYVPRNLDAAVSSSFDFSFYNDEPFPLALECHAQDGVLTVIFRRAN